MWEIISFKFYEQLKAGQTVTIVPLYCSIYPGNIMKELLRNSWEIVEK